MTNQTQNFLNLEAAQYKHLHKLSMRHLQDEDPYFQEQSRERQEKPKLEKMSKLQRNLQFLERNIQRVKTKL